MIKSEHGRHGDLGSGAGFWYAEQGGGEEEQVPSNMTLLEQTYYLMQSRSLPYLHW